MAIILDAAAYLRIDAPQTFGTSASGASFATSTGDILDVACFGPGIFRLRLGPNTKPDYGILVGRAKACTTTRVDGGWRFEAGDGALVVHGTPLSCALQWKGADVLASTTDEAVHGGTRIPAFGRLRTGNQWTAAFALPSAASVYGFGATYGPLDKRGQLIHSQVDDAQGVNTGLTSRATPFALCPGDGRGAWGVFVHTPGLVSHGVGHPEWSHRSYALVVEDEALDVFLLAGDAPQDILAHYATLTGRPSGVPDWSLGVWIAGDAFGGTAHAAEIATQLRARRLPSDVLLLDAESVWGQRGGFDFRFRDDDAENALAPLHALGYRVGARTTPCVSSASPLYAELASHRFLLGDAQGYPCAVDTGHDDAGAGAGLIDFTQPLAYNGWRDAYEALFGAGIDVLAADGGAHVPDVAAPANGDHGHRLHNAYPQLYNRCLLDATAKFQPRADAPPIVLTQCGWAGSQRTPLGGIGEAQSDWDGLAAALRGALSEGMSGSPFHALVAGGTYGSAPASAELVVRWLQASVFASHAMLHVRGDAWPWTLGGEAEAIVRKWLAFRYRLVPYLARAARDAMETGLPVMRAMPLAYPHNTLVRGFETQFMCGDSLLVAPIVEPGGGVDIALPPGAWYDLNTRARHAGKQVIRYTAPLDQFPVFGREGDLLPLGRAVTQTREIDAAHPLDMLWVFGPPRRTLDGFAQAGVRADGGGRLRVEAAAGVNVQVFGDAAAVTVVTR